MREKHAMRSTKYLSVSLWKPIQHGVGGRPPVPAGGHSGHGHANTAELAMPGKQFRRKADNKNILFESSFGWTYVTPLPFFL